MSKQTEMKAQPRVRRKKADVIVALDRAAKALDVARTERLAAQADEREAETKCNDLMAGHELSAYQLSDGRLLEYGPKSDKYGCKIVAADEPEHEPEDPRQLKACE